MAVSAVHYTIIRELFMRGMLPQNGALLELGEANWYGDIDPLAMVHDIRAAITDPLRRDALIKRLSDVVARDDKWAGFDVVKVFYEFCFAPTELQAVDPGGTSTAHNLNLNYPIALNRRFDVVINHGTAEHIFNIAQVFATIHDYTLPGGMMIHESPLRGWIDHGFYNLQPTLFFDVAEQNQYRIIQMIVADLVERTGLQIQSRAELQALAAAKQIPDNAQLFTIMSKSADERPFEIPMQGCYPKGLRDSATDSSRSVP